MQLTKNFSLKELTVTSQPYDNTPDNTQIGNIKALCVNLLQPLRNKYNSPMTINSGFRSAQVNKAVGGVATSQHTKGMAADVRCESPKQLLNVLKSSGLVFDQAILYPTFLHLSYNPSGNNRKQIIIK